MKGRVIRQKHIVRADLYNYPDWLFVFGDNMLREGLGGQAAEMRGENNAVGIPTKWLPNNKPAAFFSDSDYDDPIVRRAIDRAFARLKKASESGITVVIPEAGIGTGLADLPNKAPKLHTLIQQKLEELSQ